jgi:hypothetical protein
MYFAFVVLCAYQVTELYYYRLQEHEMDAKQLALVAVRTYFMNSHERSVFRGCLVARLSCHVAPQFCRRRCGGRFGRCGLGVAWHPTSHTKLAFNISRIQCGIFLAFRYHTILLFVHIYVFNNHRWTS